ncbi:MAG: hypothetical protein M3Y09_18075 [Actinomycetota bacterium]|nr:hypothetical protein [Actinomycetota bacterium]
MSDRRAWLAEWRPDAGRRLRRAAEIGIATQILIGKPGTAAPAASVSPNTPSGCSGGYSCAYEGTNYTTNDWAYKFPVRYSPYTALQGGCWSLNSGWSFNDCTQSVYNDYGSCSYVQWWWNAGYGGNSFKNNDYSGDPALGNIGQGDQFSSQINCN